MGKLQSVARDWALGLIDPDVLATLPERERKAILADRDLVWYRDLAAAVSGELDERRVSYVLSAEHAIGRGKDIVVLQSGWELDRFKGHGSPLLFMHNIEQLRAPIGKLDKLNKNGRTKDGVRALTGVAEFVPEGINPFADMVAAQVLAGFMPAGSVGFNLLESRKPKTEAEMAKYGLQGDFAVLFTRQELLEFSVVDIPKDPKAVKQFESVWTPEFESRLLDGVNEGRWSEEHVYQMRGLMTGQAEKTSVVVPEPPASTTTGASADVVAITQTVDMSQQPPVKPPTEPAKASEPAPQGKRIEDVLAAVTNFQERVCARLDEIEEQLRQRAEVAPERQEKSAAELMFGDESEFSAEDRAFLELVGVTSPTETKA